jgi:CheY-like chemotaxis protein
MAVHILFVEDDPLIRELLAEVLEDEDYDVIQAADGNEAIACSRSDRGDRQIAACFREQRRSFRSTMELLAGGGSSPSKQYGE